MTKYSVFANGIFWGAFDAPSPEEAIEMAAKEYGTEGYTEGMVAEEYSEDDENYT